MQLSTSGGCANDAVMALGKEAKMLGTARIVGDNDDPQIPANDIPNFWQKYGLKQSPFDEGSQFAMFYSLPKWQEHLDYLKTINDTEIPLTLVTGVLGSGKSLLLTQFMSQTSEHLSTYQVNGHPSVTVSKLAAIINDAPDGAVQGLVQGQLPVLRNALVANPSGTLLLVDDAHRLPLDTLAGLLQIANEQGQQQYRVHIILFGEPTLQKRIDSLQENSRTKLNIKLIEIKPLDYEETKGYLKFRFNKSGLHSDMPLTEGMMTRIFRLSGGVPGRINRVAQQVMADELKADDIPVSPQVKKRSSDDGGSKKRNYTKPLSLALIVVLAGGFWLLQHQQSVISESQSIAINKPMPISKPVQMAQPVNSIPAAEQTTLQKHNVVVTASNEPAAPVAPIKLAANNKVPVVTRYNEPSAAPITIAAAPVVTQQPVPVKPIVLKPVQKPIVKPVMTASNAKYTLQLMGVRKVTDIERYLAHHALPVSTKYVATTYEGRPWFVLVHGKYQTIAEAKQAMKNLPAKVKALKPWIRPVASLKSTHNQT